jgi:MoxR-like ATPase
MKPSKKKKPDSGTAELVGRSDERLRIEACLRASRNVLIEGPVGVGKTHLALAICHELKRPVFRVDGDGRFTEQKLSGWFDPPQVMKHGYSSKSFVAGPLVEAMSKGGVLFINELNRLPEGVQNVLLPAIDERQIVVPRLGTVRAAAGFSVIATQNPKEFVATSHLSEAILDRFELVVLDYQSEADECSIVGRSVSEQRVVRAAVALARMTRGHPRFKRGASVRAAQAVAEICSALVESGLSLSNAFVSAALLAMPTRVELERDIDAGGGGPAEVREMIEALANDALAGKTPDAVKKKS